MSSTVSAAPSSASRICAQNSASSERGRGSRAARRATRTSAGEGAPEPPPAARRASSILAQSQSNPRALSALPSSSRRIGSWPARSRCRGPPRARRGDRHRCPQSTGRRGRRAAEADIVAGYAAPAWRPQAGCTSRRRARPREPTAAHPREPIRLHPAALQRRERGAQLQRDEDEDQAAAERRARRRLDHRGAEEHALEELANACAQLIYRRGAASEPVRRYAPTWTSTVEQRWREQGVGDVRSDPGNRCIQAEPQTRGGARAACGEPKIGCDPINRPIATATAVRPADSSLPWRSRHRAARLLSEERVFRQRSGFAFPCSVVCHRPVVLERMSLTVMGVASSSASRATHRGGRRQIA